MLQLNMSLRGQAEKVVAYMDLAASLHIQSLHDPIAGQAAKPQLQPHIDGEN